MDVQSVMDAPSRRTDTRRRETVIALGALALGTLTLALPVMAFLFIPLPLGMWATISFSNESGEAVEVTPLGFEENRDLVGPMLRLQGGSWVRRPPNRNFPVAVSGVFSMTYDTDDQNLQWVLIDAGDARVRILTIDEPLWQTRGYLACCWRPAAAVYVIPPLDQMEDAPPELLSTLEGEFVAYSP